MDPTVTRIMVAVDFSAGSQAAVTLATEAAQRLGAEVCLVHVMQKGAPGVPTEVATGVRRLASDELEKTTLQGVRVAERELCETDGPIGAELCAAAKRLGAQLMVMGTRGANADGDLFGSVAAHVCEESPVPVLVAPEESSTRPAFGHFLSAIDFSNRTPAVIQLTDTLARAFDAKVTLLHVVDDVVRSSYELLDRDSILAVAPDFDRLDHELRRFGADLQRPPASTLVREGHASSVIVDAAIDTDADVIVVGASTKGVVGQPYLGRVADRTLRKSGVPVLVVK